MKTSSIKNTGTRFIGLCALTGMLLFSACGDNAGRNPEETPADEAAYGMGADPESPNAGAALERTSNTYTAQRSYDASTMGTAAQNRKPLGANGQVLTVEEYQRLRQDYDNINTQLRDAYRNSPGINMRYTDDYKTADFNYDYYGVYYNNVNDQRTRDQFVSLEKRRNELKNQLRGKADPKTGAYLAAEMDAVPKEGYDKLYEHLQSKTSTNAQQGQANNQTGNAGNKDVSGTVFVEFVVDKNGNVTNLRAVDAIEKQAAIAANSGGGTVQDSDGTVPNTADPVEDPNTGSTGVTGSPETTSSGTTGTAGATGNGTAGTAGANGNAGATGSGAIGSGAVGTSGAAGNSNTTGTAGGDATQSGTNTERNNANAKQLEQKAIAALKSTSGMWEPAQMNGKPVASVVVLPVPVNMDVMGTGSSVTLKSLGHPEVNR